MPTFSHSSLDKLATCHPHLQQIMKEVIKHVDIIILCGHRGEKEQNAAFENHTSQLKWPNGKHNRMPAMAVDIAPYPVDWYDLGRFQTVADVVKNVAKTMGIEIAWGGEWKSFKDLPHFELTGEGK